MTTKALLENAVMVAGQSVPTQMSALAEYLGEIRAIPANLRNEQEKDLVKVAKAYNSGLQVVDVSVAITAGGILPDGRPQLAIASLYASMTRLNANCTVEADGRVRFDSDKPGWPKFVVELPAGTLPQVKGLATWSYPLRGETAVPLVPPSIRSPRKGEYAVLFEVKEWKPTLVPVDPYLLKWIAGNVYVICGSWNLTEAEIKAYQAARTIGIEF